MSHDAQWVVDKRVLFIRYTGDLDKSELQALNEELQIWIEKGEEPIHLISDNSQMGKVPFDLKTIQSTLSVFRNRKWGVVTIVGTDTMVRFFAQVVSNAFRFKIQLVKTVEEAKDYLKKYEPGLPLE